MIRNVFVRSAYNYDMDQVSDETGLKCEDPSLAVQSSLEETDINVIVRRFGLTGQLPQGLVAPQFGDFTSVVDFHSAMNAVRQAGETFMEMPAEVRARFHNDPQEFLLFCEDDANRDEARKLGLLIPEKQNLAAGAVDVVVPPTVAGTQP